MNKKKNSPRKEPTFVEEVVDLTEAALDDFLGGGTGLWRSSTTTELALDEAAGEEIGEACGEDLTKSCS